MKNLAYLLVALLFLESLTSLASAELIAHFKFDSTSGNVAVDSVAGNNGEIKNYNDPGNTTGSFEAGAPGFGNAYNFNGTDASDTPLAVFDGLDIGGANLTQVTVAYWKKGNNLPNDSSYPYAEDFHEPSMHLHSWASWNPNIGGGLVYQSAHVGNVITDQIGGGIPMPATTLNEWHHYAVTKDAQTGDLKTYIDGLIIGNAAGFVAPFNPPTHFEIGCSIFGGACLDGALDDFRIYNTALTGNEVFDLMTPPSGDPADLNMDGFVDGLDLGILLGNWNTNTTPDMGELDGTPPVDGLDLGILLGAWNPPPLGTAAAVPEPTSIALLVLATLSLLAAGRQRS